MTQRNMTDYLLGKVKPREFLEKIYTHLINSEDENDSSTFGVTSTINYKTNAIQFGAVISPGSLSDIGKCVKEAFLKEDFSENTEYFQEKEFKVRLGMEKENSVYIAIVSLAPYNPRLPVFNHTVDIRRIGA